MIVMNLSPLSSKLMEVTSLVSLGDHVLHFEHEEDGPVVRACIFCEKCSSEKVCVRAKAAIVSAASHETALIEMYYIALKDFEENVHSDCEEASKVMDCKEVLDT